MAVPSWGEGGAESRRANGSSAHSGRWAVVSGGKAWGGGGVGGGKKFQNLCSLFCSRGERSEKEINGRYEFFNSSVTLVH
jgi:hypothetical protein